MSIEDGEELAIRALVDEHIAEALQKAIEGDDYLTKNLFENLPPEEEDPDAHEIAIARLEEIREWISKLPLTLDDIYFVNNLFCKLRLMTLG